MSEAEGEMQKLRACLAYTRRYGWIIVEPEVSSGGKTFYRVRRAPARPFIIAEDVLATVDLPPVPELAA